MVSSLVELHFIKITLVLAFAITIVVLAVYAINLRKFKVTINNYLRFTKVGYFGIGAVLLCIIFINAAIHFKVYRDAVSVKRKFFDDCGN